MTIRVVAPFARGGATDLVTRLWADALAQRENLEIEIDNEPGEGGTRAAARVARATPDGRTLVMGSSSTHGICSAVFREVPYDWARDFAPIAPLVLAPGVLVVPEQSGISAVSELIERARAQPHELEFGSAGFGQTIHLSGELFRTLAGIDIVHAPRVGSAVALEELAQGRLDLMFDSIMSALPYVRSGSLRALAVTGAKRAPQLPNVPTMIESGFPDYDLAAWIGLLAPRGTPEEALQRLERATHEILQTGAVRAQLEAMGAEVLVQSREEFTAFVSGEAAKWARVVERCGVIA